MLDGGAAFATVVANLAGRDSVEKRVDMIDGVSEVCAERAVKSEGEPLCVLRLVGLRGERGESVKARGQRSARIGCGKFRRHARENSGNPCNCHVRSAWPFMEEMAFDGQVRGVYLARTASERQSRETPIPEPPPSRRISWRYLPAVLVEFLVQSVQLYAIVGLLFSLAFTWKGAAVVDPVATHATLGFRVLLLPGAALLWPLLAHRWWKAALAGSADVPGDHTERWQQGSEKLRSIALVMWLVLTPLLGAVLLFAMLSREGAAPATRDALQLPEIRATNEGSEDAR